MGIDGGGSTTRALLVDDSGRIKQYASSGPSNLNFTDAETVGNHLKETFDKVLEGSSGNRQLCDGIFLGIAGAGDRKNAVKIRNLVDALGVVRNDKIWVAHDLAIAHAGALLLEPGIVVVVGTGSAAFGKNEKGQTGQCGGWGALMDDGGSGYAIGIAALKAVVCMLDGRGPETLLKERIFGLLQIKHQSDLSNRLYQRDLARMEIASWTPYVMDLAEKGDLTAFQILEKAALEIVYLIVSLGKKLQMQSPVTTVITGTLGESKGLYRDLINSGLNGYPGEYRVEKAALNPVQGAVLLAMQRNGLAIRKEILSNLGKFRKS